MERLTVRDEFVGLLIKEEEQKMIVDAIVEKIGR